MRSLLDLTRKILAPNAPPQLLRTLEYAIRRDPEGHAYAGRILFLLDHEKAASLSVARALLPYAEPTAVVNWVRSAVEADFPETMAVAWSLIDAEHQRAAFQHAARVGSERCLEWILEHRDVSVIDFSTKARALAEALRAPSNRGVRLLLDQTHALGPVVAHVMKFPQKEAALAQLDQMLSAALDSGGRTDLPPEVLPPFARRHLPATAARLEARRLAAHLTEGSVVRPSPPRF